MDLNLLTALDALIEAESVGAAAERLHLSPPAMSRTLSRIRRATGDEILVRTGRTMTPTPRALALRTEVRDLVARGHAALSPQGDLEPATLERIFVLQGHDAALTALAAPLLRAVAEQAPLVRLRLLAEASTDSARLDHTEVDLRLGSAGRVRADVTVATVAADRLVVALRAGHPLLDEPLDVRRYAAADHVLVSRRGRLRDRIDDLLAARGHRRRVVASLPTSAAALALVASSDLVANVTARACAPWTDALDLRTRPVPLPVDPAPLRLSWHRRHDHDPAHRWLRDLVEDLAADLTRAPDVP